MIINIADIDKEIRRNIIKNFKEGLYLGELCRKYQFDVSTILEILKKARVKRKILYDVYANQEDRRIKRNIEIVLEQDKYYIEKFFPTDDNWTNSYYWYWKKNLDKLEKKKANCKHEIRHIRCSICGKILADASDIEIKRNQYKRSINE